MDIIDTETLAALRSLQEDGDDDLLAELIDLFLEDAPGRMAAIRAAVEASDWIALAERAHSLKGSCASLGAVHMASLCGRLEAMGRDQAQRSDAAGRVRRAGAAVRPGTGRAPARAQRAALNPPTAGGSLPAYSLRRPPRL